MTIEEDDNKGQRRTPTDLPLVGICLRAAATNTATKRDETSGKQKTGKRSHGVDAGSGAKMGLWVKGGGSHCCLSTQVGLWRNQESLLFEVPVNELKISQTES